MVGTSLERYFGRFGKTEGKVSFDSFGVPFFAVITVPSGHVNVSYLMIHSGRKCFSHRTVSSEGVKSFLGIPLIHWSRRSLSFGKRNTDVVLLPL